MFGSNTGNTSSPFGGGATSGTSNLARVVLRLRLDFRNCRSRYTVHVVRLAYCMAMVEKMVKMGKYCLPGHLLFIARPGN
jgi:hypothetical protein